MCKKKKKWPTYKNRKKLSALLSQNNKVKTQISVCVSSPTALYVLIKSSVYFTVYNNICRSYIILPFLYTSFLFFVLFFEYVSKSLFLPVPHVAEFPQCGINNIQNYYYSAVWSLLNSPIWTSNKHRQKDLKKKKKKINFLCNAILNYKTASFGILLLFLLLLFTLEKVWSY